MRRRIILRRSSLPRATAALAMLAGPALGAGLAYAATPHSRHGSQPAIRASVRQRRIPYGQDLTVTGRAPAGEEGQIVRLAFQRAGSSHWERIASARVGQGDRFRFHKRIRWSGAVKVIADWRPRDTAADTSTSNTTPGTTTATASPAADTSGPTHAASKSHRVTVVPVLKVGYHASRDLGDHVITVPGRFLPRSRGRRVRLEAYTNGRWHTAAADSTGSQGRFRLRFTPHSDSERLRVRFGGDRSNAAASRSAGGVRVYRQSTASWYQDGGSTACGFHAQYGVANMSLPCGTKVTFIYHGHTVTATVDDRGPYVGGREWDLNQNAAGALGFGGVDSVWASR